MPQRTLWLSTALALALQAGAFTATGQEKALVQEPALVSIPTLTEEAAQRIVEAARRKAEGLESGVLPPRKCRMHIYVLGREGTLLAATQALGAWPGSADIAHRKALTSWLFKLPTRTVGELSRSDQEAKAPLYGIEISNGGLISFPGGLPILDKDGALTGSIGVSGDTVEKDEEVARAGAEEARQLGRKGIANLTSLSQAAAEAILRAASARAAQTDSGVYKAKTKMHIYVLGREGTVLAATQSDNAWPGSADIAYRKARTSWFFSFPTGFLGQLSRLDQKEGAPLYGVELSNGGLITFPGGLPILDSKGEPVGSIGVSGDTVANDHEVAQAGVDAFQRMMQASK
jgi:uncharacterized protein GlcG (DUF336 family)